jgi:hypothetical protein
MIAVANRPRVRRIVRASVAVCLTAAALACGSDDDGGGGTAPASLTGRWRGAESDYAYVLDLVQTGAELTGTGTETAGGAVAPLAVGGTRTGEAVALTIVYQSGAGFTYAGTVTGGRTIAGTSSRGGGAGRPLTLTKD